MLGHGGEDWKPCVDVRWGETDARSDVLIRRGVIEGGRAPIPFLCLVPASFAATAPAILYCHAHGGRYDIGKSEVIDGRPALLDPSLGLWLARRGHVVMCPDMPGFGARMGEGSESALAKAAHWHGRSMLGDMLADLRCAHVVLSGMPEVDPARIATAGISMGATLSYWYAALEPSIAATAHFCAFADMAPLIATGAHDLHGHYMTVPGLLPEHDMGDVAALVAPRPQLVGSGLRDPLTPVAALEPALARLRFAYGGMEDRLEIVIEPDGGHAESHAMRNALGTFLERHLASVGTDSRP